MRMTKDALRGVVFLILGALTLAFSASFPFGSLLHMGPGFLPIVMGTLVAAIGCWFLVAALFFAEPTDEPPPTFALRPMVVITFAAVVFAILLPRAGLIISVVVLSSLCQLADSEGSWRERVAVPLILAGLALVIFVYVLEIPLPIWIK